MSQQQTMGRNTCKTGYASALLQGPEEKVNTINQDEQVANAKSGDSSGIAQTTTAYNALPLEF